MSGERSCYWHDCQDVFGREHGKDKWDRLQLEYQAMVCVALSVGDHYQQHAVLDAAMWKAHGDEWEAAKKAAEHRFLRDFRSATMRVQEIDERKRDEERAWRS